MQRSSVSVLIGGLAMIAATAGGVAYYTDNQVLDGPGVAWKPIPGALKVELILPENAGEYTGSSLPITEDELQVLPPDTSFGRRRYTAPDGLVIDVSVVLMGGDQSSIHRPQACIPAQGWTIQSETVEELDFTKRGSGPLKYNRMLSAKVFPIEGRPTEVSSLYLYWFVSRERVTHRRGDRMLSLAKHVLTTGKVERWAYVSAFAAFPPQSEAVVHDRMREFLELAVPEFQLAGFADDGLKH